ncbi:MAG: hypothetical protein WCW87_02720 [Candidatus Paceibacterota bacterium]
MIRVRLRLKNLNFAFTSPQNSNYEMYSPEEFARLKAEIITERNQLEKQMAGVKERLDGSLEVTERIFTFCAFALKNFNTDDLQKKRNIFSTIGSNLILKDKKLIIDKLHPFLLIENELKNQKKLNEELEPKKPLTPQGQKRLFSIQTKSMLRG